jgi:hypothetical protein
MKIARVKEMQEMDRRAMEVYGIPELVLMENAGGAAVSVLQKEVGLRGRCFAVVCGIGNNGGDGFVVAGRCIPWEAMYGSSSSAIRDESGRRPGQPGDGGASGPGMLCCVSTERFAGSGRGRRHHRRPVRYGPGQGGHRLLQGGHPGRQRRGAARPQPGHPLGDPGDTGAVLGVAAGPTGPLPSGFPRRGTSSTRATISEGDSMSLPFPFPRPCATGTI